MDENTSTNYCWKIKKVGDYNMANNELMHYGVNGMKWGVRRGIKELNNAYRDGGVDRGQHNHAVSVLTTHRNKINKKIGKLDTQHKKLDKQVYKQTTKIAPKISKLETKANKLELKAYKTRNYDKSEALKQKASKLNYKVALLKKDVVSIKAKVAKNERLQQMFKEGLSSIDKAMTLKGKEFLFMNGNGMPYTNASIDSWTDDKNIVNSYKNLN